METHATTKKSLMGRLKNLVHKEKAEKPVFKKTVIGAEQMGSPMAPVEETMPTQSPAPEMMGTIHETVPVISDSDVEAKLKEVKEAFPEPTEKEHVCNKTCKHSHKAPQKKSKKMKELFPGYEGLKFTPKSPSKATLEQKRQKKARRLARLKRK